MILYCHVAILGHITATIIAMSTIQGNWHQFISDLRTHQAATSTSPNVKRRAAAKCTPTSTIQLPAVTWPDPLGKSHDS